MISVTRHGKSRGEKMRPDGRPGLDLFGEVLITTHDVYAWLLAVVDLDPASERAAGYVRTYGVIDKIARAKQDGSFDELTASARDSARYRELIEQPASTATSGNVAGVGDWVAMLPAKPLRKGTRAPRRTKEVVQRERARLRHEKAIRKQLKATMLCRLPAWTPALSDILQDIGNPTADQLAMAMGVHADTARRWIREDDAPKSVLLALYWITRYGAAAADANAHNDAVMSAGLARARQQEVTSLQQQVAHIERLADFGSANDPLPHVSSKLAASPQPFPSVALTPVGAASSAPETSSVEPTRRVRHG